MRALLVLFTTVLSLATAGVASAAEAPLRVLYLDQSVGWRHRPVTRPADDSHAPSEAAMIAIGKASGAFVAEVTQDAREITPERLERVDVLVFYTTGALPISPQAWAAVQRRFADGKLGFVGLHSAADTAWDYSGEGLDYTRFVGGQFAGHPWTEDQKVRIKALDNHPLAAPWGRSVDLVEEIYQYKRFDPAAVRVIQSLDFSGTPLKRPYAVPVSWVRSVGKGRLFFTNLGHNEATWADPRFAEQIVKAVRWTAWRARGDDTPNPREQARDQVRAILTYAGEADVEARVARVKDEAWLLAAAARIAALREVYPGKPDADRTKFEAAYGPLLAEVRAKTGR
ncbi:glycosyl hydrolase [Caulobacter flavus]|uniref:Glycosyl hydrolase n=1 Tax=Caulobacter flavus TaxID=1679497 RepID=A0A2N5CXM7_9CAUL|nr:ThuA domain-containing protein [Caulobacter flavus]AYV47272.1 glycosyl hydrolase [Caulobacter flavus]PLR18567.1 glycosyl hydrolase [Caulobacter flavus]